MYAASAVLSWYPSFYQKTNYYCTVAVSQSIAYFEVGATTSAQEALPGGQNKDLPQTVTQT